MFAIIQSGGRQVKVTPGDVITVDRVDAEPGDEVTIDQVLFLEKDGGEVLAGAPFVANVKVVGVVDGEVARPEDPRLQEEAPQGHAPDQGSPQHLHARSASRTSSSSCHFSCHSTRTSWQQKKVKAVHATAATATRSASASSGSTATSSPAARSSCASAAAASARASTSASARTTRCSRRSTARVKFEDHGAAAASSASIPLAD